MRSPLAIGERTAKRRSGGKRSRDAGNNLIRYASLIERGHFFGRAAKEEGIATLEADDAAARARVFDHQRVDLFLRDGFCAAALADVHNHCVGRSQVENC